MKQWNKTKTYLFLSLCVLAGMLLLSNVEGAAAWLQLGQKMSNDFFAPVVDIEIIKADAATNYHIENKSNTTVYVRAEVVGTLKEKEVILSSVNASTNAVKPVTGFAVSMNVGNDWKLGADGYYYYVHPLKIGESTSLLLKPDSVYSSEYDLQVYAQAIMPEDLATAWTGASLDENLELVPPPFN